VAGIIADVALQDNTDERTPLVLVLDCSGSMKGDPIIALNTGLQTLETALRNDPTTSTRGRVLVIEFGGDDEVIHGEWQDAIDFSAPYLNAKGQTPTGAAISTALRAIDVEKTRLKAAGISYKRPILMLLSDGDPTDDWESAAEECRKAESANKVTVFAIGIGDDAQRDVLGRFSSRGAVHIKGLQFNELFVWLSASIKAISQTVNGRIADLAPIDSWVSDWKESARVLAYCSADNIPFAIRFEKNNENIWEAQSAFKLSPKQSKTGYKNSNALSGSFSIGTNYPGCPSCGDGSFFLCNCGTVNCQGSVKSEEGNKMLAYCVVCENADYLEGTIESLNKVSGTDDLGGAY
jgi:uncharacterized protein YegL